jgi:protoheme IX farnesyltransferase
VEKVKAYYQLTKPGVLYGNVLTAVAGFFLAAQGEVAWGVFAAMLIGQTLVIASACVMNNYLDQDIDKIMKRTRERPSVTGAVGNIQMPLFSAILGITGLAVLIAWTNWLVVIIGVIGWITYVWLYGALSKRKSIHGTLVGSISGAMPIAGGYAAVSGTVDMGLIIVFLILFFWQFPEFYSIAVYRRKEYKAAGVPVMSVIKGNTSTIRQIFIYTILYVISTIALMPLGYTGVIYFVIMLLTGLYWLWIGYQGLRLTKEAEQDAWARRMFKFSMITILVLCVMLSVGPLLP